MRVEILAIIANYDFAENADRLKAGLSKHFPTILLDNSSPLAPATVDFILPNNRYTGLWNEAVRLAKERRAEWLLFVASDIQIPEMEKFGVCAKSVARKNSIGVYTPSLMKDSRLAYPACFRRETGGLRQCYLVEGFFFMARTRILAKQYPIPLHESKFGFGIDVMTAQLAHKMGYKVVVDDRVSIYHPTATHETPLDKAVIEQTKYMGVEGLKFRDWIFERLNREGRLKEIPRLAALNCARPFLRAFNAIVRN